MLTAAGEKKVRQAVPILESVEERFLAHNGELRARLERDLRVAVDKESASTGKSALSDDD